MDKSIQDFTSFKDAKAHYDSEYYLDPTPENTRNSLDKLINVAEFWAERDDSDALCWLGNGKYYGYDGLEVDKQRGIFLLNRSADLENIEAIRSLAHIFVVNEDRYLDAFYLYVKGSSLGDLECKDWLKLNARNLPDHAFDFPITRMLDRHLPLPKDVEIYDFPEAPDELMSNAMGWSDAKNKYKQIVLLSKLNLPNTACSHLIYPHFIMTGPKGTGKHFFTKILGKKLNEIGYLRHGHVAVIDLADIMTRDRRSFLMRTTFEGERNIEREHNGNFWFNIFDDMALIAQGGILLIKDSRKCDISNEYRNDLLYEQFVLGQILQFVKSENPNFLVGLHFEDENQLKEMFKHQSELQNYFNTHIKFDDFSIDDLGKIAVSEMEKLLFEVKHDALPLINEELLFRRKHALYQGKNICLVKNLISQILPKAISREENSLTIRKEDIPNSNFIFDHSNVEEALNELNELIGLGNVKAEINNITNLLRALKSNGSDSPSLHFVFTGAPGTGKTTVARLLGKILYKLGYLSSGHVVETDGTAMIGKYTGSTPTIVKDKLDQADGGILFIDEAYTLGQSKLDSYQDKFREEAIAVLLKYMEDRRGRMVVIAAGYDKEMIDFIESNSGLQSRFTYFINFDSYTPEENCEIFKSLCSKNGYTVSEEAQEKIYLHVGQIKTVSQINTFGNARGVRTLYEKAIARSYKRQVDQGNGSVPKRIEASDVLLNKQPSIKVTSKADIDKLLQPINSLIEQDDIKKYVENLVYLSQSQLNRVSDGRPRIPLTLHSIFTGAPGTGKTTVARHMGKILADLGYLSKGHVVEVSKNSMVGQWLGHTPKIVEQKVSMARGGILFIDEAYTLADSVFGNEFGKEALDTLTKMMEDQRDDLIIIAAGYTKEMEKFKNSNSGLLSRFPFSCTFKSYSHQALVEIFLNFCASAGFDVTDEAVDRVLNRIKVLDTVDIDKLGNGRFARNIFELTSISQAKRVIKENICKEDFYKIVPSDITLPENPSDNSKIGFL